MRPRHLRLVPPWPTPAALVVLLRGRGVELADDGGRLRWRAPPGAMTVVLLREVKAAEAAILARLAAEAREAAGERGGKSAPIR